MKAFFGNKKTKVLHDNSKSDSCRRGEILAKNRVEFASLSEAKEAGYRACKICLK